MRVFTQPASLAKGAVREHYQNTILQPVVFDDHADLFDSDVRDQLHGQFPGGAAQMWGVTPGKTGTNVPKVRQMRAGDVVFFSGNNRLYLVGTVALTWHNRPLAERLWSQDDEGLTWEYMYALTDVRGLNVPMYEVRSLLGWKHNRNIMGFNRVSDDEGELLLDLIDFDPADTMTDTATETSDEARGQGPPEHGASDRSGGTVATRRAEQSRIKAVLLPGDDGECALCGRVLPRAFLVAAHIKKRAACTEEERWDIQNIAMRACLLGCDSLFEHGFITVDSNGDLQVSAQAATTPTVAKHIDDLAGRHVPWWNPDREKYYAWHRDNTFKTGAPLPGQVLH